MAGNVGGQPESLAIRIPAGPRIGMSKLPLATSQPHAALRSGVGRIGLMWAANVLQRRTAQA